MDPYKALDHLYYTPKKSAKALYKAIKSAIDNAKNISQDVENLKFKKLLVEEGRKLKRYRAGGRGTAKPILRRYAHIQVVLEAINKVKSSALSSSSDSKSPSRKRGSAKRHPELDSGSGVNQIPDQVGNDKSDAGNDKSDAGNDKGDVKNNA
jgi:hypothetical protein